MSDLTNIDKKYIEKFFEMAGGGSGYVLNFTNNSLQKFVIDSVELDIYNTKYDYNSGSKANRLRRFFEIEDNRNVGKLILDMIKYLEVEADLSNNIIISETDKRILDKCRVIAGSLLNKAKEKQAEIINFFKDNRYKEIGRKKYLEEFRRDNFHDFQCPMCRNGFLEIIDDTFKEFCTEKSGKVYGEVGEVHVLEKRFISFLRCNNKKCNETSLINGIGRVDQITGCDQFGNSPEDPYLEYYTIKYFDPPAHIIYISEFIPNGIKLLLEESFLLFWIDCSSAGNKIRKTLELLMDNFKIDKCKLHQRIEKFGKIENSKYFELAEMLMSIKWLGNAGSHNGHLSREDLLDAYDILDFVLAELFIKDNFSNKVKSKAKGLNEKYGTKN